MTTPGTAEGSGGNLLEHLPERLPGRLAEQAEFAAVVFENGAQELGDGEDVVSSCRKVYIEIKQLYNGHC